MHIVVIYGWLEATAELVQTLSAILGLTSFEMRQRVIGGGPTVVARYADPHQAAALAEKLRLSGVKSVVIDAAEVRSRAGRLTVRRFELGASRLQLDVVGGGSSEIPYAEVTLLLPAICVIGQTEKVTVTERKFNLGATIASGGIPMIKKVQRQEEVQSEQREKALYLYTANRPAVIFRQNGMTYEGFGTAMKPSRELNFAFLGNELRRLCPDALYDDRLLQRAGQVRVLGPTLNPDANLDLAVEIVARCIE